MKKKQVMQDLFGDLSDEEESNEGDEDSDFEYEGSVGVGEASRRDVPNVTHQYNLRNSRSSGAEGLAVSSAAVIHEDYGDSNEREQEEYAIHSQITEKNKNEGDGDSELENKGNAEINEGSMRGSRIVTHQYNLRSLRSSANKKEKGLAVSPAAVIDGVCGDSNDHNEQEELAVRSQFSEKNSKRSRKCKKSCGKESQGEGIIPCEDALDETVDEYTEPELKGKTDVPPLVYEIPLRPPPAHSDQMATVKLSSLIGIDPRPYDPETYVEDEYYVTDALGCKRAVPSTNIIRWREIKNPDGTTSVESNARFVTWMDGSVQLFIGKVSFDVSEHDAKEIQSHLFLQHEKGFFQCQGKLSRKMKLIPASVSSSPHHVTGHVNSRLGKICKVQECVTSVDPERKLMEEKEEGRKLKGNKKA